MPSFKKFVFAINHRNTRTVLLGAVVRPNSSTVQGKNSTNASWISLSRSLSRSNRSICWPRARISSLGRRKEGWVCRGVFRDDETPKTPAAERSGVAWPVSETLLKLRTRLFATCQALYLQAFRHETYRVAQGLRPGRSGGAKKHY